MTSSRNSLRLGVLLVLIAGSVFYTRAGIYNTRAYAATISTLNFQARLSSSTGSVVPDGNYTIEFKLYTVASGGSSIWSEKYQGSAFTCPQGSATGNANNQVRVVNGYLTVNLGNLCTFPASVDWSQEHWLSMNVNSDGEMNPRLKLTAVPYAFRAGQADSLTNGSGSLSAADIIHKTPVSLQEFNSLVAGIRLNQTGSGGLLQLQGDGADVFTVSKTGLVFAKGSVDIDGTSLDIGTSALAGSLVLNDGSSNTGSILTTALSANRTYTFPDASGTVCLTTTCSGAANAFVNGGNSFGGIASLGTNDNFALTFRTNNTNQMTLGANGSLDLLTGGLLINGTSVITNGRVLQNVTANASILTSGILGNNRGGTGLDTSLAANGQLLIGNGSGFSLATLVNNGGLTITNSAGGIGLGVNYGSLANTAVQGNTTLICPSGTGNLSGTGNTVTLGTGGTCSALDTKTAVAFSTSVTTPLITNAGPLTISTTGANDLTLTSGSGLVVLNANTLRRTASGTTTFDLSDLANTTLAFTNSGVGVLNMSVDGSGTFGNGLTVTSGGASIAGDVSVNGGLTVANTFTAVAGMIRWTGLDFQGYDGTQWKSFTGGGGGGGTTVVEAGAGITKTKGSNQIVTSSTVLVNDTDLFIPIAASETRAFRFVIHAISTAQANLKFAVTAPLGATCAVAVSDPEAAAGSGNVACGVEVAVVGTGGDEVYEITGAVTNSVTAGTIQLQWAQATSRATATTVYARSFVHSTSTTADITALTHFKQGGNAFAATGVIGTTDNFGLNLIVNNSTVLNLATSGLATFSGGVTANGLLTISSGGASITGGLNLNNGGISNAGSILGVGANVTATAGLTIASSSAGNLTLNSASGLAVLGATTLRTADSLSLDLQKSTDSLLTLQNSGAGIVNLNLADGGLQTGGTLRLSNGGALQNITGLTVSSGGASISGNVTLGTAAADRMTINGQVLGANALVFQGATDNSFATTLVIADPTASNTITLPNASGALVLDSRSILTPAGSGLSGGGTLAANRSLSLDINGLSTITTANNSDYIAVHDSNTGSIKKVSRSDFLQGIIGALRYLGAWNAATNTPTLSDATGTNGDEYVVSVGGTRNLGSGNITFGAGDFIIHNGTRWEVAPSSADVNSVFGRTGSITAQSGDYTALQITNTPAGNIAAITVQAALNELDNEKLSGLNGLTGANQTFANDTNVTITSSGTTHALGWSGQLSVGRGGTGVGSFTTNGILYGNNTGALQVTAAGTGGQVLLANATGVPTFTTLSGDVTIDSSGVASIGVDKVALGLDTTGDYMASLGTLTGLSVTGNSGEGSTPALSVIYGSVANSAVRGNTTLTCASGTGNLTGGGTIITLGSGGTCASLNTNAAVSFATSVTTPILTSSAGLVISSGGSDGITLNSASNIISLHSTDTTLQRIAAGTTTIDLSDASANTTLTITNSDAVRTANLNVEGVYQQNGVSGVATLNCLDGQYINQASVRGGIITAGNCANDAGGILSDTRVKENVVQLGSTLDKIGGLNVVNFNYKCEDPAYAELRLDCSRQTGLIAQELEKIFPELVITREDGYKTINQRALSFYNLKAVVEIASKVSSNGDARLRDVSTGGELRLTSTGALQNINGINASGAISFSSLNSGGLVKSSVTGGLSTAVAGVDYERPLSFLNGLTRTGDNVTLGGSLDGSTTLNINGQNLSFAGGSGGVISITDNAALDIRSDSTSALAVKGADGTMAYFNVSTAGKLVQIGSEVADDAAVLLVLDSKATADDPSGTPGATYYNAKMSRFRCFEQSIWKDCISESSVIKKTDQQVTNSAVMTDDSDLAIAVEANSYYTFNGVINFNAPSAIADYRFTFNVPAGATVHITAISTISNGDNATTRSCVITSASTSCLVPVSSGLRGNIQISGYISTGSSAGNLRYMFAQNNATAAQSVTTYKGSSLNWRRTLQ